jgi:Tol biopolymer transport system component
MNVAEAAFLPDGSLIVSAAENGAAVQLYRVSASGRIDPLDAGEARYPAVSRDGHWLAFSRFAHGNWNLYLRDLQTGAMRRLTDAPCNQIQPSWEADSKTLLYASDCGRALWFTAIARRQFLH